MKFSLRKLYKTVSLILLFVASWATFAHAATQDVRVTNWPTTYSVVNTTWDSRLSTLQTTLQSLAADMSQFPTFVSRFGWNGTVSFSQGFELLYNDVHSLATDTSQASSLSAFNREFPVSGFNSGSSTKYIINRITSNLLGSSAYVAGTPLYDLNTTTSHIDSDLHTIGSTTLHLDSDLHTIGSTISAINLDTTTIKNLVNSNLPAIKVNTDNIAVDTESINTYTSYLPTMASDLNILQEFFADADTVAQKAAAESASDSALNNFTGNGQSSASATDYADIDWAFSDVKGSMGTGSVSALDAPAVITGSDQNAWAWFSQATYDSINPAPTRGGLLNAESYLAFYEEQLASDTRKGFSDTPLLDGYYKDINKAVGK